MVFFDFLTELMKQFVFLLTGDHVAEQGPRRGVQQQLFPLDAPLPGALRLLLELHHRDWFLVRLANGLTQDVDFFLVAIRFVVIVNLFHVLLSVFFRSHSYFAGLHWLERAQGMIVEEGSS